MIAIVLPLFLGGCAAAAVPMVAAEFGVLGFSTYKGAQGLTGDTTHQVTFDDSKLTTSQKAQLKAIKSIAVWPEKGAVKFAEALADGGKFNVVSPSRVAQALKKLELSDDMQQMTTKETKEAFLKVCMETKADAIIIGKTTGQKVDTKLLSFDRPTATMDLLTLIYEKSKNDYIAEIPGSLIMVVGGGTPPLSNEAIYDIVNNVLAKKMIELAQNPEVSQEPVAVQQPVEVQQPVKQPPSLVKKTSKKKV